MNVRKIARYVLIAAIIAASIGLVVFCAYLIRLDDDVRRSFAGVRWELPAQVYAAPLELFPGQRIGAEDLSHELRRIGYRQVTTLQGPGTFVLSKTEVDVHTRAFTFWDGPQPELELAVNTADNKVTTLKDLTTGQDRVIVRIDPMIIGSIYPKHGEDRVLVKINEVPDLLKNGLVAVEDRNFYHHHGISLRGIARAAMANMRAGHVVQGASTITQQLVRNFFLTLDVNWHRKIKEMLMSVLLELHYSKQEILEAYMNEIFLGQDGNRAIHGFGLASHFYFNKPLNELQVHEIALLVGIVKGASYYNPRRHPQLAMERRNLVLKVFLDEGLIDQAKFDDAVKRPLGVVDYGGNGVERYPAFVDLVRRQLHGQYKDADLTAEGLRIFTTLDPRAQEALENNIAGQLPEIEKARRMPNDTLQAAGVVTSVEGGDVLAVVGGRQTRYAGFNRALDSRRSIGSLAKPFLYMTALAQPDRYNLQTILEDEPIEVPLPNGQTWAPTNFDHKYLGADPLYDALAHSRNVPAVRTGLDVGAPAVLQTMKDAGYTGDAKAVPSIFLGAVDAAPLDVAQMFDTLATGGYRSPLSSIRDVTTKEGQPLNRYPLKVRQTLPEAPVYLVVWAMQKVMREGTGASAYRVITDGRALAGKSGTTNDLRDSWFAGFGGDRVAVVWVGRDDYKPMGLTGSSGALQIWSRVMKDIDPSPLDPLPPEDIVEQLADPTTGLKADEGCPGAIMIPYIRGYAPQTYAPCSKEATPSALQWLREIFQ